MSPFKTKKLPKKVREASLSSPVDKSSGGTISSFKKRYFSVKIFVGVLLAVFFIFFVSQVAQRAFSGNQQNGSEKFVPKVITEDYITEKIKGTTNILIA
jgi:hypothetical protein